MRDPGLLAPAAAGWRLSELELARVEVAEARSQQTGEGKAGTEERASCWRPALQLYGSAPPGCDGIQAGNIAAESPRTFL